MKEEFLVNVNVEGAIYKDGKWLLVLRSNKEVHASGDLALVGGKVECQNTETQNILEQTLQREIKEEVGIEVFSEMHYLKSSTFVSVDNRNFVDIVFLCIYKSGEAKIASEEVSEVKWMAIEEIISDYRIKTWTQDSLYKAENYIKVFHNGLKLRKTEQI